MKPIYVISFVLLVFQSCSCKHCMDYLTAENNKIPYTHGEVLAFTNDTLGVLYDTVYLDLGSINTEASYGCVVSSEDYYEYCSNWSEIKYSNNFKFGILQTPNINKNKIGYYNSGQFFKIKDDTILYKQKPVKALCFYSNVDTVGSEIWNYTMSKDSTFAYNNFYFITDTVIKLIQYTTVYKDGTRRIWRLKE
ncbi:MAG: hypothetical protein BWY22_00719 [Bacteroidetes bacterium ADurb.Bin217]|nr:MAG: hypothetical protein BWY22_00719 [Bacteroidetes bacterium ADurb.Bin217]